jgi:hypothetical protein
MRCSGSRRCNSLASTSHNLHLGRYRQQSLIGKQVDKVMPMHWPAHGHVEMGLKTVVIMREKSQGKEKRRRS